VLLVALATTVASLHVAAGEVEMMENAVRANGAWKLAPGPNVEGVALLHQGAWPPDVVRTFHEVPWLDAASVRIRWAELEPRDGEFDWSPFDAVLAEVRRYNTAHPGARRTMHVRPLGGVHCPEWFEAAGVRFYDTLQPMGPGRPWRPLRTVMPYDNPQFLRQLRQLYRALIERYGDEPLVTVYHGTWSAGPWDEIFHPEGDAPLPPDYAPEKFVAGMVEQLDVLIEELCLKGKVAELPYSGKYPQKARLDITGPLTDHAVRRLGRRSPYLYIQSNGWGMTGRGTHSVCWGHEADIKAAHGRVNLALQALGTNAGGGWWPQGDWVELVKLAQRYDVAYIEIYPPDLMPLDTEHRIVEAFTGGGGEEGFVGFRPWLRRRDRTLYVRDGTVRLRFASPNGVRAVAHVALQAEEPPHTRLDCRVRTRRNGGAWSDWFAGGDMPDLPAGDEAEVEVALHTDDGCVTPVLHRVEIAWQ
jgi:hypothetical protein